ncbi:hypothetical protein COO91_09388 (plasmid) [Nostoc flagelliforme CCNUN1]|uniref:Uncharacterized protein n=1 Tax=Nostoc flagelliforme CCNUN1 TaxID=2038116 RepID=A0A2K8T803_9NOSO|nr:hypothetical protein COO91_09388 [Nostoc flagelliforme CCNUN1]
MLQIFLKPFHGSCAGNLEPLSLETAEVSTLQDCERLRLHRMSVDSSG